MQPVQFPDFYEQLCADTNLPLVEKIQTHIIGVRLATEATIRTEATMKLPRNFPMLFRAALRTIVLQNQSKDALRLA